MSACNGAVRRPPPGGVRPCMGDGCPGSGSPSHSLSIPINVTGVNHKPCILHVLNAYYHPLYHTAENLHLNDLYEGYYCGYLPERRRRRWGLGEITSGIFLLSTAQCSIRRACLYRSGRRVHTACSFLLLSGRPNIFSKLF